MLIQHYTVCCSALLWIQVAVCCSALLCIQAAAYCSVLQRVAVCCMHVRGARNKIGSFLRSTHWGTSIGTSKNLNSRQLNGAIGSNLLFCVSFWSTTSRSNLGTRIGTKNEEKPESQIIKWCWIWFTNLRLFVYLFVCWNTTRQTILRLLLGGR